MDVRLAYAVIISIPFGMRQGLIASGPACLAYLYSMSRSGADLSFMLYNTESWISFIVYDASDAIAGYAADKRANKLEETRDEMGELGEKCQFLKMVYRKVLEMKSQLQKQVTMSRDSSLHVYEIPKKLDSLSPKAVFSKTLQVMGGIMECHSVVIYLKTDTAGRYGRTIACSEEVSGETTPSIGFGSFPQIQEILAEDKLLVNRELLKEYPSYAIPTIKDGQVAVIACLYDMKFDKFTVYYKNMFRTVVQAVQSNLLYAYDYQDVEGEKRYLEGIGFLNLQVHKAELQILRGTEEGTHTRFITRIINISERMGIKELSGKASGLIRGIDIIGKDSRGHFCTILINTDETGRQMMEKKFLNRGLLITREEQPVSSVYWIFTVLHILLSFMYVYDRYMKREHLEEAVFRGIICLVMPVLGYLFFWLLDYFVRRNSKKRAHNLYLDNQRTVDDFPLLCPIEKQEEINKAPVLEALVANSYRYHREITVDTLKDEDIISYLLVLKKALENEDAEVSHYASAVIMDAQKRAHEYLTEKEATLEADPNDRETLEAFEQELLKVLLGDVFDERSIREHFSVYQMVSDRLLGPEDRKDIYFRNRILMDPELEGIGHASQVCEAFKKEYLDSKDMVTDTIQLCIRVENRGMLDVSLRELRHLPMFLIGKSLQYTRFSSRNGEVET